MSKKQKTINCYECKHRGIVSGSVHSCCQHPKVKAESQDPVGNLMATLASVNRAKPCLAISAAAELNIQLNNHGVMKGWANWPWNFDPVWLENCNGFEKEDSENK